MKKISLFILRHGENYWKKEDNKKCEYLLAFNSKVRDYGPY